MNKSYIYHQTQFNPQKNIFGDLARERHRQKRKIYGQALSDQSLRAFEPVMIEEIEGFLRQLSKAGNEVVNMSPLAERLTADVADQLAFRQPLDTQTKIRTASSPRQWRQ
jgi:cytochrome P450